MNEAPTTIALVKDEHGMPVGRIRIEPDYDGGAGMNMEEQIGGCGVTIAPVWVSRNTDEGFYQVGHDSRFLSALKRFDDEFGYGGTSWEFGGSVEVFTRYMRIFHPLVPVVDQWIDTGYSQGVLVRVLAWAERTADDVSTSTPGYQWATRMHEAIEEQFLPTLGAHARNQYVTTTYETMSVDQIIVEDEENIALTVTWEKQESIGGTMYLEEFNPNPTAIDTAKYNFGLEDMTIEEV